MAYFGAPFQTVGGNYIIGAHPSMVQQIDSKLSVLLAGNVAWSNDMNEFIEDVMGSWDPFQ